MNKRDFIFGSLITICIGVIIYLIYRCFHKKFFNQVRDVSNQYTASGYLITDVHLLLLTYILTCFVIVVWGMILAKMIYL